MANRRASAPQGDNYGNNSIVTRDHDDETTVQDSARSHTSSVNGKDIISWPDGDPENPYNWSTGRKRVILWTGISTVINSTLGSSLPSNAVSYIVADFNITNTAEYVLPISTFLMGYIFGPLLWGPISESYGRRVTLVVPFALFTIFTMACALAPSWNALIGFRFLSGVSASCPLVVVPGIYADIHKDPRLRGRAMALFMSATCLGPLFAPVISGFISPVLGWRWSFWIGLMILGVCWPPLLFAMPETRGAILLSRRAKAMRAATGNPNIFAPSDLEDQDLKQLVMVTLMRPLRMLFGELIVSATAAYTSLAYAIFYIYFTAYPLIFEGIYGMSTGVAGLMFLPIGVGAALAIVLFNAYDSYLIKAKALDRPWTRKEESRRLPLAYLGGPLYVISLFWLGWTARSEVPWVVPFLAGIPFGMGFVLIFMALLNYVTDAYAVYAASAMAGLSCCRSIAGAVLPFAARPMYTKLGINWGSSLLGFLSLLMCLIPFAFVRWGETIRRNSKFCMALQEQREREEAELERRREAHEKSEDRVQVALQEP